MLIPFPKSESCIAREQQERLVPVSHFLPLILEWGRLWEVPYLHTYLRIRYRNLRSSAARCRPMTGEIGLNADYLLDYPAMLIPTLCHQVGHVAVYLLH